MMESLEKKKVGIVASCFLVRSALELIVGDLKLPFVTVDDPSQLPSDAHVVLLSFTTASALSDCVASCMDRPTPARIVLFPQDSALLDSVNNFPADVAAVVPPTLATAEIKSVISLVVEGHRILPFSPPEGEHMSGAGLPARIKPGVLTTRQMEILSEVAKGESNKAIARTFSISINTVEAHVSRIIRRLKVGNRTQAALALREGPSLPDPSLSSRNGGGEGYGMAALQSAVRH